MPPAGRCRIPPWAAAATARSTCGAAITWCRTARSGGRARTGSRSWTTVPAHGEEYNIISDCRVLGAGYTKSDGGICVNLETDHSKIAGLVLQVDATSALASEATSGVTVSGENILVENVVVNGAGGYAEAGVGVGVSINNSARDTSHLTLSNLRATSMRYACTMYSRPGWTVSRVVLNNMQCRDVDGAVMVYDLSQNTSRVTVSGARRVVESWHDLRRGGRVDGGGLRIHECRQSGLLPQHSPGIERAVPWLCMERHGQGSA